MSSTCPGFVRRPELHNRIGCSSRPAQGRGLSGLPCDRHDHCPNPFSPGTSRGSTASRSSCPAAPLRSRRPPRAAGPPCRSAGCTAAGSARTPCRSGARPGDPGRVDAVVEVAEGESAGSGLVLHPPQRDVGELPLRVAATDVTVHAGEPHLLQLLGRGSVGLLLPDRGLERLPLLVDRDCLVGGSTVVLRSVSWNCQRRLMTFASLSPLRGMPSAPTVSHTPMKRIPVSWE